MNEVQIRREIFRLFRRRGYWPITQTDLRPVLSSSANKCLWMLKQNIDRTAPHLSGSWYALQAALKQSTSVPSPGRPDILCLTPDDRPSIVCEVKVFRVHKDHPTDVEWQKFSLDQIKDEQMQWMTRFDRASMYYVNGDNAEVLYPVRGSWLALGTILGDPRHDRYLWLIPLRDWYNNVDQVLRVHTKTLNLVNRKGQRKAVQEQKLNAIRLLQRYALTWTGRKDREWVPGLDHPFKQHIEWIQL